MQTQHIKTEQPDENVECVTYQQHEEMPSDHPTGPVLQRCDGGQGCSFQASNYGYQPLDACDSW